jgi:capsular polysaccharide transport system permease protein
MEPKRFRSIITIFIISMVGWAVMSILIASVREHAD